MWQEGNMRSTKRVSVSRLKPFRIGTALLLTMLVLAAPNLAHAQNVFVPGNASGYFGNPVDQPVPLVSAVTVSGPGTITVTYVSGTVDVGGGHVVGPHGFGPWPTAGNQYPLQEARGVTTQAAFRIGALIGIFVAASRVNAAGFMAIDGTKNAAPAGIVPGGLVFIGKGKTFNVAEAGTLFLGINDTFVSDNSGGFNVTVTGP
jgi:hypothetical protein